MVNAINFGTTEFILETFSQAVFHSICTATYCSKAAASSEDEILSQDIEEQR
jgi:hypothetical protein